MSAPNAKATAKAAGRVLLYTAVWAAGLAINVWWVRVWGRR